MKIGICTSAQNALLLSNDAADYIEMNITSIAQMSDGEFESTKKLIAENNISVQAANCFFPGDIRLCGSEMDIERIASYAEHALKRVSELGIEICVIGSGKARNADKNEVFETCYSEFIRVCCIIGDIAKKYGIIVVIEPLNKNETNMINTVAEGAKLVRSLNHPNVRLLADIYHMALEEENLEAIYDNRDIIAHMHIANPDKRVFPDEFDSFDYEAVAEIIRKSAYNKRLSIEAGGKSDFKSDAGKSLVFLKRIFK